VEGLGSKPVNLLGRLDKRRAAKEEEIVGHERRPEEGREERGGKNTGSTLLEEDLRRLLEKAIDHILSLLDHHRTESNCGERGYSGRDIKEDFHGIREGPNT